MKRKLMAKGILLMSVSVSENEKSSQTLQVILEN